MAPVPWVDTVPMGSMPPPLTGTAAGDTAAPTHQAGPYAAIPGTVLLAGITGDTAHGFPSTDLQRLAIYATTVQNLIDLYPPDSTTVTEPPDPVIAHEAGAFLRLLLTGTPTLLELLWLDGLTTASGTPLWEVVDPVAVRLVELRHQLVSAGTVRNAYLGYARSQFVHLIPHQPDVAGTARRMRHLARLMRTGYTLYTTGVLPVRVDDPGWYDDFVRHPDRWQGWFEAEERGWNRARSALTSRPHIAAAQDWLREVRAAHP